MLEILSKNHNIGQENDSKLLDFYSEISESLEIFDPLNNDIKSSDDSENQAIKHDKLLEQIS